MGAKILPKTVSAQELTHPRHSLVVALKCDGVPAGNEYFGIAMLEDIVCQTVVIHMAMGDDEEFQARKIDALQQSGLTLRRGRTRVEQRRPTVKLGAVEVNLPHHVGGLYGVLLHDAPG